MLSMKEYTAMHPDIERVVGAKEVLDNGGKVVLICTDTDPTTGKKWSTTDIIERIKALPI